MEQMKNTSSFFPFKMSCSAISSELAESNETQVQPIYVLSGEVWHDRAFNEWLQAKNHTSDMETRPSDSTMHETIETGLQKNGSRGSRLMSQYLK